MTKASVNKRTRRTARDLTGLSKREALKLAKTLLPRAQAGDLNDAAMLIDVMIYAGQPSAAESLTFALQGRTYPAGDLLPPDSAARNLKDALFWASRALFPPRAKPCMPSVHDLGELVHTARVDDERTTLRQLRRVLQGACNSGNWRVLERAMITANDMLRGHGVERVEVPTLRGPQDLSFDYVNFGDTYVATLVWDNHAERFRVTSWGDMLEAWENRWGRADNGWPP